MLKKLKQFFCRHKWKCVYVYGFSADYKCLKCNKHIKESIFFLKLNK